MDQSQGLAQQKLDGDGAILAAAKLRQVGGASEVRLSREESPLRGELKPPENTQTGPFLRAAMQAAKDSYSAGPGVMLPAKMCMHETIQSLWDVRLRPA